MLGEATAYPALTYHKILCLSEEIITYGFATEFELDVPCE